MKHFKFLLYCFFSIYLFSCAGDTTKDSATGQPTAESTETMATTDDPEHAESTEAIELDNGNKWKVNDEMKPFVIKGQELVSNYLQNNETDYTTLAKEVKEQNDQLIKSCNMKGKSHDELHKWLHPHLELVKELQDTRDSDKASTLVSQLDKSYKSYSNYFQ